MKRKAPPFRFVTKAKAHSDGHLKAGCRQIRVRGGLRFLCETGLGRARKRHR